MKIEDLLPYLESVISKFCYDFEIYIKKSRTDKTDKGNQGNCVKAHDHGYYLHF